MLQRRVHFRQERLDLLSLISVQKLAQRLRKTTPYLDVAIFNAGIGGWTGINWPVAIFKVLTSLKTAVSYPTFKISGYGWAAKPQLPDGSDSGEPALGEVFCANFFGHYFLGHYLAPLLAQHPAVEETRGRIIWVSSLEAYSFTLKEGDMQGLTSQLPYESSKRLTDIIAVSSTLPSTSQEVDQYLGNIQPSEWTTKPRMYVSHPGICGTSIVPLHFILQCLMFAVFYIARWSGSQWHTITVEKGAVSMVWLALAKQSTLDAMEQKEGVGKWGSATDFRGQERVERAEIAGWGWGGIFGEYKRKGRDPHAQDMTTQSRLEFEQTGKRCWQQMEGLRIEWEDRLRNAGVGIELD